MTSAAIDLPAPEATGADYFDIEAALAALETGRPVLFPPFELAHWGGLTFALNFRRDPIQNALRAGRFYEAAELAALQARLQPGARILDVGANIGNHAVFFAARMQAARVVVVEPNPLALAPLLANILLNRLQDVICTDLLGVGLSDRAGSGFGMARHDRNLGATRLRANAGQMNVLRGDDLLEGEAFDLVKIDVEGMELAVLAGLEATIARCRPLLLVEAADQNRAALDALAARLGYRMQADWRVGPQNANYLLSAA